MADRRSTQYRQFDIRFYILDNRNLPDELLLQCDISSLGGVCPAPGDKVALPTSQSFRVFEVHERCFMPAKGRDEGIAVIIKEVDHSPALQRLFAVWNEDTVLSDQMEWDSVSEDEEQP